VLLWTAAVILTAIAACIQPEALLPAARATLGPFATLAAIIAGSVLAGRLGLFRALAGLLIRDRASRAVAAASVLAFTALLSGLVNLDVAVVVAMPVALETAGRQHMSAGRLAVAVAVTANAASFLLPTSNITSLLLLSRVPLPPLPYLRGSWLAWLLVVAVTIGSLSGWLASAGAGAARPSRASEASPVSRARPSARAALDLIPMFAAASAIRAILAAGIALRGGLAAQLAIGSAVTAVANNLPTAAVLRPAGWAGLWAAILATAIGPGLFITGSVATLICRRIARDAGAKLRALQFSAIGSALLPAQLAAAVIGLHLTGALR
jgi:Na+/H+ antiporter NhaD/arsenite permease-like protein